MKKFALIIAMLLFVASGAHSQGFLKKIGKAVKDKTQNKTEETVDKTVDKVFDGIDGILDGKKKKDKNKDNDEDEDDGEEVTVAKPGTWTCPNPECGHKGNTGKFCDQCGTKRPDNTPAEAQYEQSDFVPGAVAFFEDDLKTEQMGEFPSKWDLIEGSADVANLKGFKCLHFEPGSRVEPLMTNQKSYIPDVFTLEFDFWMNDPKTELSNCYELEFKDAQGDDAYEIRIGESYDKLSVTCRYISTAGDWRDSGDGKTWELKKNDWSHFALSFNKRALKIYVNNKRVINIPNCRPAVRMIIHQAEWGGFNGNNNYVGNVSLSNNLLIENDSLRKEVESLKETLKAKDEALKAKDEVIQTKIDYIETLKAQNSSK